MERTSFDIRKERLDLLSSQLDASASPKHLQSAATQDTALRDTDDAGDVKDWIAQVKQLQLQRKAEDEARNKKLEEDILAERRARQERRANRSRSVSPEKLGIPSTSAVKLQSDQAASSPKPMIPSPTQPPVAKDEEPLKATAQKTESLLDTSRVSQTNDSLDSGPMVRSPDRAASSQGQDARSPAEPKRSAREMLEKRDPSYFRQTPKPVGLRKSSSGPAASKPMALPGMSTKEDANVDEASTAGGCQLPPRSDVASSKPKSADSPIIPIKPNWTKLPEQTATLTSPSFKRLSVQLSPVSTPTLGSPRATPSPGTPNRIGGRSGSPTRAESPTRFANMQAGSSMSSTDLLATMRSGLRSTTTQRQATPDHVKATLLSAKGGLRSPTSPSARTFGTPESKSPTKLLDSPRLLPPTRDRQDNTLAQISRQNSAPVAAAPGDTPLPAALARHSSMPPQEVAQSALSSRFNPTLVGLLQRGPPAPVKQLTNENSPIISTGSVEEEKSALSEPSQRLTHMTKTRARRTGKRPPTALPKEVISNAQVTVSAQSLDPKLDPIRPAQAQSALFERSRPVSPNVVRPTSQGLSKPGLAPSVLAKADLEDLQKKLKPPGSKPEAQAKSSLAERFSKNNVESLLVAPKPMNSPHRFDVKRKEDRSPTLPEVKTSPLLPDFKRLSLSSPKGFDPQRNSAELGSPASAGAGAIPGMWSHARRQDSIPIEKPLPAAKPVASIQLEDVVPKNAPQTKLPSKAEAAARRDTKPNSASVQLEDDVLRPAPQTRLPSKPAVSADREESTKEIVQTSEAVTPPALSAKRSISPFKREGRIQPALQKTASSSSSMTGVADLIRSRANSILVRDLSIKAAPSLPSPQTSPRLPWQESARPPPTSTAPSVTRLNSRPGAGVSALLFCVRQHVKSVVIDEVVSNASNLCSGFAFVVQKPEEVFIWQGRGAASAEVEAAREFAHSLSDASPLILREGEETAEFWQALGGQTRYASASYWRLKKDFKFYRTALYTVDRVDQKIHISVKDSFSVDDVKKDKIHVLDTFFELYTLIPSLEANVKRDEILAALRFVRDHSTKSGHTRPFVPMALVVSCRSRWPRDLKAVFREPVDDQHPNLAIIEHETAEQVLRFTKFSKKELSEGTALGADYKRLEDYCEAACFGELFGMELQQFKRASFEEQKRSRERALQALGVSLIV